MGLTAFVTGGSGFVGMNLLERLVRDGWQVYALVRDSSPLEDIRELPVRLVYGDVTDADSVLRAMPDQPDGVFHVAASTSVWSGHNTLQRRINLDGTRHLLQAAVERGARRFVHTSSFVVYGFHHEPITEDSPRLDNADWINYVRTKFEAESAVKQAVADGRIEAVILNPAHILGPGDRHNWSRAFRMLHEGRLPGVPPGGGAFSDVREVAAAHVRAFHDGRNGENYLLGGHDVMFTEVIRLAGKYLGRKVPERASPAWLLNAAGWVYAGIARVTGREPDLTPEGAAMIVRHIHCDSGKAARELGYRFTPIETLVRDTIAWMREKRLIA